MTARRGCRVRQFDSRTEVVPTDREAAFGAVSHVADYAAAGPRIAYPELTAVVVMTATTAPTPVGLAIGSETPEEIAVSVAAQLLRERNRR